MLRVCDVLFRAVPIRERNVLVGALVLVTMPGSAMSQTVPSPLDYKSNGSILAEPSFSRSAQDCETAAKQEARKEKPVTLQLNLRDTKEDGREATSRPRRAAAASEQCNAASGEPVCSRASSGDGIAAECTASDERSGIAFDRERVLR